MTATINTLKEEYTVIGTGLNDSTIMNEKIQISEGFLIDYTQQFNNDEEDDTKIMKKKIKKSKPLYNNTTTTVSSLSTPTLSTIKSTKSYLKQQYIYFSSFIYPLPSHGHHKSMNQHRKNNHHHSLKALTLEQKYGKLQSKTIGRGAYANVKLIINKSSSPSSSKKTTNHHYDNDNNEKSIYAVKIFKKRKHHGKTMKKLISEYCIASTMDHPNIVKTYDFLKNTCGHYCLVMEYVINNNK